jgi:uncharacterized protein (TIGR03083 family)
MTATVTAVRAAALPKTGRHAAALLATAQHNAMLKLLHGVDERLWDGPTDCARWTVRHIVAHLVGSLADGAYLRSVMRHVVAGRRKHRDLCPLDAMNEAQIDDRRDWPVARLIGDFERLAPKAVRARRRMPSLFRRLRLPSSMVVSGTTLGDLLDVIYIRDMWMHRVDIARATDRPVPADESDAEVVAQVIRDLGRRWTGPSTRLTLTSPGLTGAASWLLGEGKVVAIVTTDAVEFCRLLSGRPADPSYDIDGDQSVRDVLNAARVMF